MFHKILVAVDASERAAGVFKLAVDVARMSAARLYVMRVVTIPPEFPPAAAGSPTDPLIARTAGTAMHDLERLIADAPHEVSIRQPIVRLGIPWKIILETADERDVDLIVLGSHGYHGWDRILGTTAGKIANVAQRNVLIAHERNGTTTTRPNEGTSEPNELSGPAERKDTAGAHARRMAKLHRIRTMNRGGSVSSRRPP